MNDVEISSDKFKNIIVIIIMFFKYIKNYYSKKNTAVNLTVFALCL